MIDGDCVIVVICVREHVGDTDPVAVGVGVPETANIMERTALLSESLIRANVPAASIAMPIGL